MTDTFPTITADDLIADDDATPLDHRVMGLAHILLGLGDIDDAERVRVAAALLREAPGRLGPSHRSLYEALCDIGDAVTTMCDIIESHDLPVIDHG